jgi:hypothetical protein
MISYAIRNPLGLRRLYGAHGDDGRSQAEGEDFHIYGSCRVRRPHLSGGSDFEALALKLRAAAFWRSNVSGRIDT